MEGPSDEEVLERLTWGEVDERAALKRELAGWFARDPEAATLRLRAVVKRAHGLRSGVPLRAKGAFACILALAEGLGPDRPLPVECDLALTFHEDPLVVRSLLQRIPGPRRPAMFDAWLAEGSWSKYLVPYLDLAPTAAIAIFEQAAAKGELRQTVGWVAAHRGKAPELDEILARFEARLAEEPPPPPPPPPRVGSFRFVDPVRVLPADYAGLDRVARSQYRQIAGSYVESGKVRSPSDFVRQLEREGLGEGDAELRRWKVLRGDEHVFDLWVVWVENAMFFRAGTDEPVGVSVIQGSYLPSDGDDPALVDLAADLGASGGEDLWGSSG